MDTVVFRTRMCQLVSVEDLTEGETIAVAEGRPYRWIARDLGISQNTVLEIMKRHREKPYDTILPPAGLDPFYDGQCAFDASNFSQGKRQFMVSRV